MSFKEKYIKTNEDDSHPSSFPKKIVRGNLGQSKTYIYAEDLEAKTLRYIEMIYAYENKRLRDSVILSMPTSELLKYREYDRSDLKYSKHDDESIDKLRSDIRRDGVKEPVIMNYWKSSKTGNVKVFLGEGNHRVMIAKELGIESIPTRFFYTITGENF